MRWVLIVEDHALFREGLALLLKWRTGLDNVQSGSIAETRRILGDAKEEPVCAVVDLDLPDGDGVELLERLRGLPVVALVSARSLERCVLAFEAGGEEGLHKVGWQWESSRVADTGLFGERLSHLPGGDRSRYPFIAPAHESSHR